MRQPLRSPRGRAVRWAGIRADTAPSAASVPSGPGERRRCAVLVRDCVRGVALLSAALAATSLRADTEALLGKIDLTPPALAAVRNAREGGDLEGAGTALLRYFRARKAPRWYTDAPPAPAVREGATDPSAEKILRREYTFVGKTATLTRDLDWNANPLRDHEWPIELNRHYTWVRLVDAYNRTGNTAYAEDAIDQLTDWCGDNPRPSGPRQARYTWRTLECGIRLSGSWPRCFFGLLNSPSFTSDACCRMLNAMWEQADYLTKVHGGGNWLVTETAGLMTCGVLFPEFVGSANWRKTAFDRLAREIDQQVPPDGAQIELTPHYHSVTMRSFRNATRIAELNDVAVPANVNAGVLRMARYLMDVSKPDLHIPMFNDSDHGSVLGGLRPFGTDAQPEVQYVVSRGAEGSVPPYTSVALPYAGQYVMRSGWDEQALYLAMDAGPYGAGHQHEDKLHIDVHAFGRSHILDPGRFTYAGGPWRSYFVGTASHSTMLVNGRGQNRRRTPRRRWIGRHAQDNLWITGSVVDFATGVYDDGYGSGLEDVVHIRKVFFKRAEYWIVHDLLVGPADGLGDCTASLQYQFGTSGVTAEPDGTVIASHNPDANLAILPVSDRPFRVGLHEGEENPPKGWVAWSLHKALKTAATMAVVHQEGTLPIRVDTLLLPYAGATRPAVTIRRLPEDSSGRSALEVAGPGWRDVYHCAHDGDGVGVGWVRYDDAGREKARAADTAADGTARRDLGVEPKARKVTVTAPEAGRLVLDYGFAVGGGYVFRREQQVDEGGEHVLPLPSVRAGRGYVYSVQLQGEDGGFWHARGVHVPEGPTVFDFQDGDAGDWAGATIVSEEANAFLRAQAAAATPAVYLSITHPLSPRQGVAAPFTLRYRMPFADGGDWCYCKLSLTDSEGRRWSAYFASKPSGEWRRIEMQLEDFRRDDGREAARTAMPADVVLATLSVTVRKGVTKAPVVPVLEIDDVSWSSGR